jgi:hypothetical protein
LWHDWKVACRKSGAVIGGNYRSTLEEPLLLKQLGNMNCSNDP